MPADVALEDLEGSVASFREQLVANDRDPDSVPITLQALDTPDLDKLKEYRDIGIERVIVGVAMDMWDRPDRIVPLMDEFAEYIRQMS